MPFLRFTRDRRGYENTFLLHAVASRRAPRVLYWYRSAPGVRVGRPALDEDAIRTIEEQHPEVEFDWPQILEVGAASRAGSRTRPRCAPRRKPATAREEPHGADDPPPRLRPPIREVAPPDSRRTLGSARRARRRDGARRRGGVDAGRGCDRCARMTCSKSSSVARSPRVCARATPRSARGCIRCPRRIRARDAWQRRAEALDPGQLGHTGRDAARRASCR